MQAIIFCREEPVLGVGEKRGTISETEIDRLKEKYNLSDMSNEKDIDFLGELVKLGRTL